MTTAQAFSFLAKFPPWPGEDITGWTGADFIVARGAWSAYAWLAVMGAIFCFYMAWSIGANDVANSFGNTVGSKTLKLWQALLVASVCEFTGAIVLGGEVAHTVAGSITSPQYFAQVPEVFAFGMLCVLGTSAIVITLATYLDFAISTTHSVIGGIIGFGLVYGGPSVIVWSEPTDSFPYRRGVVTVFLSWFISPTMAAALGGIIFLLNRHLVLRRRHPDRLALVVLPVLVLITVFINVFYMLEKGAAQKLQWDRQGHHAAWVAICAGAGAAVACIPLVLYIRRRLQSQIFEQAVLKEVEADPPPKQESAFDKAIALIVPGSDSSVHAEQETTLHRWCKTLVYPMTVDIHKDAQLRGKLARMHANAEVFCPKAEEVYKYLQVFTGCCVSFAHGANDVSNAVGPFSGIWYVYQNWTVASTAATPRWVLALGGAGLVVGLATYGYNIIRVLGVEMARMTPSRGFAAELATSLTVSLATVYGLPVSTTQTIVGAEVGVGLTEGSSGNGMNATLLMYTAVGWVVAFFSSCLLCAAVFAVCIYSPSVNGLDYVDQWQNAMTNVMLSGMTILNNTVAFPPSTYPTLQQNITWLLRNLTAINNFPKYGKTNQYDVMSVLKNVTWLYLNTTKPLLEGI